MMAIPNSRNRTVFVLLTFAIALTAGVATARQPLISAILSIVFIGGVAVYGLIRRLESPVIPILILCGFGAFPTFIRAPVFSLSALITISILGILVVCVLADNHTVYGIDWLWSLFLFWSLWVTITTYGLSQGAIQNLSVYAAFFLVMLLARSQFSSGILTYHAVHKAMIGFAVLTVLFFWVPKELFQMSAPRGFALAVLISVCWFSTRWRRLISLDGLIVVSLTLILLSTLSRTALATVLLVIVLSRIDVHSMASVLRVAVVGLLAGSTGFYLLMNLESLNSRFFTGDLTLSVGGIPINGSGRTNLWEITRDSIDQSAWTYWIGQGAGSASSLIESVRPGLGHPHNDFLRIWHDFGTVGLALWVCVWVTLIVMVTRVWRQSNGLPGVPSAWIHRPGFLAALAILPPMFTDNIIVYYWAMLPSAILIGIAQASPPHRR